MWVRARWLESVVGTGGLLTVAAIIISIVLAEVLLWTYAHCARACLPAFPLFAPLLV